MRKIIIVFIGCLLLGCSSQQITKSKRDYSSGIVYILPESVIELLYKNIDNDDIYFMLNPQGDDEFTLYIHRSAKSNKWTKNTNRYINIKGKLYPLIFHSDYTFANSESAEEYLENYDKGVFVRSKTILIMDNKGRYIEFKSNGTIISNSLM